MTSRTDISQSLDTGDVAGFETTTVVLGERELLVALAATPDLRALGLMSVENLGDLDGMVFVFEGVTSGAFTMRNTLIPLDIAFFDSDGALVDRFEMTPCLEEPCTSYPAAAPFLYALEMPAGSMGSIQPDERLAVED